MTAFVGTPLLSLMGLSTPLGPIHAHAPLRPISPLPFHVSIRGRQSPFPPPGSPGSPGSLSPPGLPEQEEDFRSRQMQMQMTATRLQTIHALLHGYSSLSVAQLLQPLSPSFTHEVLPKSLGLPVRDREEFAAHASGIFSIFSEFSMIPVNNLGPERIYEDSSQGVVVIHARMEGTLRSTKQKWENECVLLVKLSADGKQVQEIKEFVDSLKAIEMRARHAPQEFGGDEKNQEGEKMVTVVKERRMSC